jgi:hypothetical protein
MIGPPFYRYYVAQHALSEFIVNFYLNMAIGAYFFWDLGQVPLWGMTSIIVDLLATGFILSFVVSFIVFVRFRKQRRQGEIGAITISARAGRIMFMLVPRNVWARPFVLGIHGLIAATVTLAALRLVDVTSLPFWPCIVFKGSFAGALASYTVVLSGCRALDDSE